MRKFEHEITVKICNINNIRTISISSKKILKIFSSWKYKAKYDTIKSMIYQTKAHSFNCWFKTPTDLVRSPWIESSYSRTEIFASLKVKMIESRLLEASPPPTLNTATLSTLPCNLNHKQKTRTEIDAQINHSIHQGNPQNHNKLNSQSPDHNLPSLSYSIA